MPSAYATIKIKVQCKSNWSPETTIEQITRQAIADAEGRLRTALADRADISIIGKPEITAVHTQLTEET